VSRGHIIRIGQTIRGLMASFRPVVYPMSPTAVNMSLMDAAFG
jgi:hypothetical protein